MSSWWSLECLNGCHNCQWKREKVFSQNKTWIHMCSVIIFFVSWDKKVNTSYYESKNFRSRCAVYTADVWFLYQYLRKQMCIKRQRLNVLTDTIIFFPIFFLHSPSKRLSPPSSPSHDHFLPKHHSGHAGRGEEDELHRSRGETHHGALGERRTHHQPGDQPIRGHCQRGGRRSRLYTGGKPSVLCTHI